MYCKSSSPYSIMLILNNISITKKFSGTYLHIWPPEPSAPTWIWHSVHTSEAPGRCGPAAGRRTVRSEECSLLANLIWTKTSFPWLLALRQGWFLIWPTIQGNILWGMTQNLGEKKGFQLLCDFKSVGIGYCKNTEVLKWLDNYAKSLELKALLLFLKGYGLHLIMYGS